MHMNRDKRQDGHCAEIRVAIFSAPEAKRGGPCEMTRLRRVVTGMLAGVKTAYDARVDGPEMAFRTLEHNESDFPELKYVLGPRPDGKSYNFTSASGAQYSASWRTYHVKFITLLLLCKKGRHRSTSMALALARLLTLNTQKSLISKIP